jgi:hypothetical protein
MLSARHCAARGTGTTEQAGVQGAGGSLRPAPRKSRGAGCYQSRTRGATVMGRRRPCSRVSALPVEKSSAQEVGPVNFAWLHHGTGFLTQVVCWVRSKILVRASRGFQNEKLCACMIHGFGLAKTLRVKLLSFMIHTISSFRDRAIVVFFKVRLRTSPFFPSLCVGSVCVRRTGSK